MHKHLRHLDQVWISNAIVFVTTCTLDRRKVLANDSMHEICLEVWENAEQLYGWAVGRYVLMPDHIHFFCAPRTDDFPLATFIGKWKEWTAKYAKRRLDFVMPLWQPEFFDHFLRTSESYEEKWLYVRDNPVRWARNLG
jgi:REP element-mobilizing transposase RayT